VNRALELKATFKGRVQGVGFRATARRLAMNLRLTGSATNLPSGDVELLLQGDRETLDLFLKKIGALFQNEIDSLETVFYPPKKIFARFEIIYTK